MSLNAEFLAQAKSEHLVGLKGHKVLGGMRASIYNAMPLEGVEVLVRYLDKFCQGSLIAKRFYDAKGSAVD